MRFLEAQLLARARDEVIAGDQERMALSVPQDHVKELLELAASEDVEATVNAFKSHVGTPVNLRIRRDGAERDLDGVVAVS